MPLNEIIEVNILDVVRVGNPKKSGHTHPIGMDCQSDDFSTPRNFIVKLYDDLPFNKHTCARELLGSLLANAFGLNTPEPAIINISPEICRTILDTELSNRLSRSMGYNFGSKTIEKGALLFTHVPNDKLQEAADVFAFDALIQNDDRRIGNPNMFLTPEGFILFDHEMAFPFSRPHDLIGGNFPEAWELNTSISGVFLKNHAVFRDIKHKTVFFEDFAEKLASLNQDVLSTLVSRLPDQWMSEEINNIAEYLARARDHANQVKRCLQEVLA
jgi:hypothetical protein